MQLLTPPGFGGIAVVAAHGAQERAALASCLCAPDGTALAIEPGQAPRRAQLVLEGVVRDEVLVVDRGERGLEVHLHGSPVLVAALAERFGPMQQPPARPAQQLLQRALSTEQLQLALEQLDCDFGAYLRELSAAPAAERAAKAAAALQRSRAALALCEPRRLVLVGSQNAGKSTLFNRLLFRERALTGDLAGLTRDPIADVTTLCGYPYELVDTAGEGPTAAPVDRAAQELGRALRSEGSLVLVVDGSAGPTAGDRALATAAALVVATRGESPLAAWPADLPCHLRLGCGDPASAGAVRSAVGEALRTRRGLPPAGPVGGPAALDAADFAALRRLASAAGIAPA